MPQILSCRRCALISGSILAGLLWFATGQDGSVAMAQANEESPVRIHAGGRPHGLGKDGTGTFPDARPRFHNANELVCSDCHVSHASQTHAYDPDNPAPGEVVPYPSSANPSLLKAPDPLDLCLACHDGQTYAPDVVGFDTNGLVQRSAGHFDAPDIPNPRGHDLGRGLEVGGFNLCMRCHFGSGLDIKVTCIDCHNPHGNNVARNLQWASDPSGTPDLGLLVNPGASGMARYEEANVSFGTLDSDVMREVSNMCIDCHHVFSGGNYIDPDSDGIHERHPSYDSERGSTNRIEQAGFGAHWDAGTGPGFDVDRVRFVVPGATDHVSATAVEASNNGVFCLSCHRGHGSDHAFGLVWPPVGEFSASGCEQCHLVVN